MSNKSTHYSENNNYFKGKKVILRLRSGQVGDGETERWELRGENKKGSEGL